METEYLRPFVEGAQEFVSLMLQSSCNVVEAPHHANVDVSGVITLDGAKVARLALSFSRDTAVRMVAQLLAVDECDVDDAILGDGVGELANIVAGAAKGRLANIDRQVRLSLPEVVIGAAHELTMSQAREAAHVRLATAYGEFSLRVWHVAPD
ncbi:MAG TPA: chemotaxis protein CheX [Polyangiaceae bacterium]